MNILRCICKALVALALLGTCSITSPKCALAREIGPLDALQLSLVTIANQAQGEVGIAVEEIQTGQRVDVNGSTNMPAASVIKIPVMVEVFRQMSLGTIGLTHTVTLLAHDRDWGWGELASAPLGSSYTINTLLRLMITESDNTATNMLIRLVTRQRINETMKSLSLNDTILGEDIRSDGNIRSLRTSPNDMVMLLNNMVHERIVDAWSSRAMLAILIGQQHNGLLPVPLPRGTEIAHKTGTLHDTLNDVGVVFLNDNPYAIAVMTTNLPTLEGGRRIIHDVSKVAYEALHRRYSDDVPDNLHDPSATTAESTALLQQRIGVEQSMPSAPTPITTESPETPIWALPSGETQAAPQ